MKPLLAILSSILVCCNVFAGPHTIQRGETYADIAKLYDIPIDSLIKANPNTEYHVGLTVEIPLNTLVFDLGHSNLFRNIRYRHNTNYPKGLNKYKSGHDIQSKLHKCTGKKRHKQEQRIIQLYEEAVTYGNTDALYQLGRYYIHGMFYSTDKFPTFQQTIAPDIDKLRKGIEYLQIAALAGNNANALVELSLACGHKDSPIYNPYLCLGMLEQYQREKGLDVNNLICYMYENGYGIRPDLMQAYIHCPETELTREGGSKTHREQILEQIESMPTNFESSKYGNGMDSKTMVSIAFSHYHDNIMEPEGIFWLHRAARLNNADANWALAGILQNGNYSPNTMGILGRKEKQMLCFIKTAAENGKKEAVEYLEAYKKTQQAKAEQEQLHILQRQREMEAKKQRRREMWVNIANTVVQTATQTYMAIESAKVQSRQKQNYRTSQV